MAHSLPSTLTPSKLDSFVHCPLAFRFSYLERLPEPPSPHLLRGTLVHRALQFFYSGHGSEELTKEQADSAFDSAWREMDNSDEFGELAFDDKEKLTFAKDARMLIDHYLSIEDPNSVSPIGLELDLRTELDGVTLRGIIDRLDRLDNGELIVVDYKTGRSPRQEFSRARFGGVQFYAFLCEKVLGRRPREIRLMYLRDRVVIVGSPTDQSMRGLQQRALAVWTAIERACETGDFRPNVSPLCKTCSFQALCPAFKASGLSLN